MRTGFFVLFVVFVLFADRAFGQSSYKNPIIDADYSDPDIIRVGDDFYLTASSFNSVPGLPILQSRDLVNWKIIGHALQSLPPLDVFARPQHGNGVWAPAIRFHKNEFYIFYGDPDFGIFMVKARNAAGPWSKPLLVRAAKGWIDTCPFWDDDGNAYLVHAWANSRSGIKSILTINRMSPDGTKLLDDGQMVFDGRVNHPTIEGPKLYKRNGYYYIFAPAGGVSTGWQTVLRARSIYGPYEDRIVMDRGQTEINGPHQGGWVELKSGESWFVHFQDRRAYGRIVHLQPVKWVNDWPVIGVDVDGDGKGEPVLSYRKPNVGREYPSESPQTTDEFSSNELGLQWQWHANPAARWSSFTTRRGWLRLTAVPWPESGKNLWAIPNLLLQKLPSREFTVTTLVDASHLREGERSGLLMMGRDYSYLAVTRDTRGLRLVRVVCLDASKGGDEKETGAVALKINQIYLRVAVSGDALCEFSYSLDGKKFEALGDAFTAQPGMWIGAKVGLFAIAQTSKMQYGYADYDWFRVRGLDGL
ncbi:MAG TPA: glycoside hydrolase 43 family protein [Pyrinomonadaceae bacterium]